MSGESPIGVVIPCFNVASEVRRAIDSVLAQTMAVADIVVVDDGSTDGTLQVLREYGDRIRVLTGPNRGSCSARNRGLRELSSEYVQFLDADDEIAPGKLEHQMGLLERLNVEASLVVGGSRRVYLDGFTRAFSPHARDAWIGLIKTDLGNTCANLWRRQAVIDAGGWDESRRSSQEYDLMFRMLINEARVILDPDVLTTIYQRAGSISNSRQGENWQRYIDLRSQIQDYLVAHGLMTTERQAALDEMFHLACRNLFPFSRDEAVRHHAELVSGDFIPRRYSKAYQIMYRYLGFSLCERIHRLLG